MKDLIGLVLCGGGSTRMGKDKGLIKKEGKTWSQRAERLLLKMEIPVYLSINQTQVREYGQYHSSGSLIIDSVDVKGPLAGILSVHRLFPESDLLVLASDMIFIQQPLLEHLVAISCLSPETDVVAYESNFLQPLCAVYKASFLQDLLDKQRSGQLTDFSLQFLLRSARLHRIPVKKDQEDSFRNCNYESDLYETSN